MINSISDKQYIWLNIYSASTMITHSQLKPTLFSSSKVVYLLPILFQASIPKGLHATEITVLTHLLFLFAIFIYCSFCCIIKMINLLTLGMGIAWFAWILCKENKHQKHILFFLGIFVSLCSALLVKKLLLCKC